MVVQWNPLMQVENCWRTKPAASLLTAQASQRALKTCMTAHMAPGLMHIKDEQSGIWRNLAAQPNKKKIKTKDLHITDKWRWQKTDTRMKKGKTEEDTPKDQGLEEDKQRLEEDLLQFDLITCSNRIQRKTFSDYFITAVPKRLKKHNPTVCQQYRLILTRRTTAHRLHNVLEESHWWNYQLDLKR